MAVDQGTGDVYVADTANSRIERFAGDGTFISTWGWGVSDGSPAAQVCTSSCQAGIPGSGAGQFNAPVFVAVDNSGGLSDGSVYVADTTTNLVQKFDAAGNLVFTWGSGGQLDGSTAPGGPFGPIAGIAVDSTGVLDVLDTNTQMFEFTESGAFATSFATARGTAPNGLAADGVGNFFKVNGDQSVEKFDAVGNDIGQVNASFATTDITVDPATGDLYVSAGAVVERYAFNGSGEVVQADSSTCVVAPFSGCQPTETFGAGDLTASSGVAVRGLDARAYISDQGSSQVEVFDFIDLPVVVTGVASDVTSTGATLNATVDPDSPPAGALSDCHFEYVTETAFQASGYTDLSSGGTVACTDLPAGDSPIAVHADVTGLTPSTAYRFRISATNPDATVKGSSVAFAAPGPPVVSGEQVRDVGKTNATLRAQVNPQLAATTYHFEYGTDTDYGQTTPESTSVGADDTNHPASTTLTGLAPGTTYHWRLVATNTVDSTPGADHTFTTHAPTPTFDACPNDNMRTGPSANLPDCRAYEQASPADKGGAAATLLRNSIAAAADGNAVMFTGAAGLPGIGGYTGLNAAYVSRRSAGGWSTTNQLMDTSTPWSSGQVFGWSDDLLHTFALGSFDGTKNNVAIGDITQGSYRVLGSAVNQGGFAADFSADGSKVLFETAGQLLPEAIFGVTNLYIWDSDTETLRLAGVLPDGSTPPAGAGAGGGTDYFLYKSNTLSGDGTAAFFTDAATGQLYVRKNPTSATATTAQVSASQKTNGAGPGGTDPNGPRPPRFRAATPSGSKVLFTSSEELTNDANTGSADQGTDLYSYDVASGQLTDLTALDAAEDPDDPDDPDDADGADVQGILGTSDDGSYVYFVANGVLAPGASPGTCKGRQGNKNCNLYLHHAGTSSFVARLTTGDGSESAFDQLNWAQTSDWGSGSGPAMARVTPDGRTLMFTSVGRLTDYDNRGPTCGLSGEGFPAQGPCVEVYRYDASDGQLDCVSCNPTGAAPVGSATVGSVPPGFAGNIVAATLTRNLSSDGKRVFFESSDPLVTSDTNNTKDVYEWEAEGHGSCPSSAHNGGCLYLLSTGRSEVPSYFGSASLSGDDVFVFTTDQLVGQDKDGSLDGYDVRVGGGLAAQNPAAPPVPCKGESCRPAATEPAVVQVPGSVTFDGPGNQPSTKPVRLSVSGRAVRGASFLLATKVSAAGTVTASGRSIKPVRRTARKARTLRLRVRLTARAKAKLKKEKKLAVRLKVTFKPTSGSRQTATVLLTVKA